MTRNTLEAAELMMGAMVALCEGCDDDELVPFGLWLVEIAAGAGVAFGDGEALRGEFRTAGEIRSRSRDGLAWLSSDPDGFMAQGDELRERYDVRLIS